MRCGCVGGRDMRPATAERLRRGLELYHFVTKGLKSKTLNPDTILLQEVCSALLHLLPISVPKP